MRRIWMLPLLSMLSLLCLTGRATPVYKCADGTGVSYQSLPCEGTQRTLRQWDTAEESAPAATSPTPAPKAQARERRSGKTRARARPDAAESRCQAAKARREAKLQTVGLKRSFDLLRKLDDEVHAACR